MFCLYEILIKKSVYFAKQIERWYTSHKTTGIAGNCQKTYHFFSSARYLLTAVLLFSIFIQHNLTNLKEFFTMKENNKNLKSAGILFLKFLSFLPAIALLFLIFGFSAQDGEASGSLSFKVSLFIVRLFSPFIPTIQSEDVLLKYAEMIHLYVRKLAHMTEYFLLALSLQLPLKVWLIRLLCWKKRILAGTALAILFAALDEFHQHFVPGRSGNLVDVCIDSIGIFAAALCCYIFYSFLQKRSEKFYKK